MGAQHVPGAQSVPLNELMKRVAEIEESAPLAIICASGYRPRSPRVSSGAPAGRPRQT